jgi:nucleoside-diphosphate-sugar epimerase
MSRHIFILGGSGQIGQATAEKFLDLGWNVTIAHRGFRVLPKRLSERGATVVTLDREAPFELANALHAGADALVDITAYGPEHARQLLDVQGNVGSLIVISSSSVYMDTIGRTLDEAAENGFPELPEPIQETQPTVAPGSANYSTKKVALERILLDEASIPVTILRPAAISGLNSTHPREWWFVKRIIDGRPIIPLAYMGTSRFHTSSVENIAEVARIAVEVPGNRILNIADPSAITVAEIATLITEYLGYTGQFVKLSGDEFPAKVGGTPWSVQRPFVLDNRAAEAIGYSPVTTYAQSVGQICNWLIKTTVGKDWRTLFPILANYPDDLFDYSSEDSLFSLTANSLSVEQYM